MSECFRHPGELIRSTRRDAGITQQQLAIRAGTSQAAISRLEGGGPSPSHDTLDRLLRVMGRRLELRSAAPEDNDVDLEEIRRARAMPIEQRLERAFAWNAFAVRIAGTARDDRPSTS
jgi:transcriptional regulator with XRE-family HTH domain